jgi:long-chain acyl-CoA synthetase
VSEITPASASADTLPGLLKAWAQSSPDRVALRNKDLGLWQEITWSSYYRQVERTAHAMADLGVGPGDHVAILSDNRPEWVYADLAAQALGARSVGVYQTNPPDDVAYVLKHSRSRLLFCEDQEQVDKAVAIAADTPTVERVVVFDPRGTRRYTDERLMSWASLMEEGERLRGDRPDWVGERIDALDPGAPSMVVYTSGTTGPPKGALISSANALVTSATMVQMLGVTGSDQVLSYLPLCHVAEKIFTLFLPLTVGGVVHFGESIDTVQQDLIEVSPTVFLGVPRIWEKMHASITLKMKDSSWLKRTLFNAALRLGRARSRSGLLSKLADLAVYRPLQERLGLRRCHLPVTGAAPLSEEIIRFFEALGVPLLEGYGQTECAGVSHINPVGQARLGSVGIPVHGTEQAIADDGEILVRGPHVFLGYLHDDEATASTVDADGWLHTGDVGVLDPDGYLTITGRKKEIIITAGGKNLSPEKIENALKTSPYIKEAVAVGDARKFISALVQIDYDAVGDWAGRRNIPYTSYADLAAKVQVVGLVDGEVRQANERLARVEQVRKTVILPKELHQDDGELTATQKVRRREVMRIFEPLIEGLYEA